MPALPSRVLASGNSPLATTTICGSATTALTATGSSITDALQLSAEVNVVATAAASTGVKLPVCENGAMVVIVNDGASTLTVYPSSSSAATLDGSTTASIASAKRRIFFGTSGSTWVSVLGA